MSRSCEDGILRLLVATVCSVLCFTAGCAVNGQGGKVDVQHSATQSSPDGAASMAADPRDVQHSATRSSPDATDLKFSNPTVTAHGGLTVVQARCVRLQRMPPNYIMGSNLGCQMTRNDGSRLAPIAVPPPGPVMPEVYGVGHAVVGICFVFYHDDLEDIKMITLRYKDKIQQFEPHTWNGEHSQK